MINLTPYFENGIHTLITKDLIKKIGLSNKDSNDSCFKIYEGYYQDTLFEDLTQSIAEKLIELNDQGLIEESYEESYSSEEGFYETDKKRLVFKDYQDDDKIKNSYALLYKCIYNTLKSYSLNNSQKSKLSGYDLFYTDDDGKQHEIGLNSSLYLYKCIEQYEGSIQDLIKNDDLVVFFSFLKSVLTKNRYSKVCTIIQGLIEGLTYLEISEKYNLSLDSIKKSMVTIRKWYKSTEYIIHLEKTLKKSYGKGIEGTIITYQEGKKEVKEALTIQKEGLKKSFKYNPDHVDTFNYNPENPIHKIADYRTNTNEKGFVDDKLKELNKTLNKLDVKLVNGIKYHKSGRTISRYDENESVYIVLNEYYNMKENRYVYC